MAALQRHALDERENRTARRERGILGGFHGHARQDVCVAAPKTSLSQAPSARPSSKTTPGRTLSALIPSGRLTLTITSRALTSPWKPAPTGRSRRGTRSLPAGVARRVT